MSIQFQDDFNRKFYYLRLSITDVCNFRCTYCLPDGYKAKQNKTPFLSIDELKRVVCAFAHCGTSKIRITGGEPSLRRDFTEIIAMIAEQKGIEKIAMTTNGYRLTKEVKKWRDAGLTHLNVSVDSLDSRMFHQITGENKFHQVMKGIDAALDAGFKTVKINAVLLKNMNDVEIPAFLNWIKDKPIQLRLIELMKTGEMTELFDKHHKSGLPVRDYLMRNNWEMKIPEKNDGPAEVYCHPDYQGEMGLIMPYKKDFCASCNRLRISALGKLHLCLFGDQGVELRDLLQTDDQNEALILRIQKELMNKKQTHFLNQGYSGSTPNLASIGG